MATRDARFEKVQRTRSYQAIVDQFRQLIDGCDLRPGDRVPPERELAITLSVSRATLREAFRVLEHVGLIESRIGDGRYVAELRPFHDRHGVPSEALEKAALFDFLEVRKALEAFMAALAAERATNEDIARIEEALKLPVSKEEIGRSSDTAFHLALAQASHNGVYTRFVSSEMFLIYRVTTTTTLLPFRSQEMNDEHLDILEAVRRHNRVYAEASMQRHLSNVEANLHRVFDEVTDLSQLRP
jgi:GntR family transcriptional regulator, transcriptional repressor for pyruvate dehydrogenase complex